MRNGIHIINLEHTYPMLQIALHMVRDKVGEGGRILFVGTKPQAGEFIKEAATKTGQFFVVHRWLGGMLTNWNTVSQSIKRLKTLEETLSLDNPKLKDFTKKEILKQTLQRDKLEAILGGIKDMSGLPDLIIVFDALKEKIVVEEAHKLNIPVVGIVDTNADPTSVTYPIPGNDDARRAIEFYCHVFTGAVLDGLQLQMSSAGVDPGVGDSHQSFVEEETTKELTQHFQTNPNTPQENPAEEMLAEKESIEGSKAESTELSKKALKATSAKDSAKPTIAEPTTNSIDVNDEKIQANVGEKTTSESTPDTKTTEKKCLSKSIFCTETENRRQQNA